MNFVDTTAYKGKRFENKTFSLCRVLFVPINVSVWVLKIPTSQKSRRTH